MHLVEVRIGLEFVVCLIIKTIDTTVHPVVGASTQEP